MGTTTERFNQEEKSFFNIVTTREEVQESMKKKDTRVLLGNKIRVNISDGSLNFLEKIEEKKELFPNLKHYSNPYQKGKETLPTMPQFTNYDEEEQNEPKSEHQEFQNCSYRSFDSVELEVCEEMPEMRRKTELQLISLEAMKHFEHDFNTEQALTRLIFKEYKRFLLLYFFYGEGVIPSPLIEWAWSYHLTDFQNYTKHCNRCFDKVLHRFFLPIQKTSELISNYRLTLQRYENVFEESPHQQVWPDVKQRFDYDQIYSCKFFNIYGYMNQMLKKQMDELSANREAIKDTMEQKRNAGYSKRALAGMKTSKEPERGANHLVFVTVSTEPKNGE